MDLKPFTPDCGHTVTPAPGGVGTGRATDPKTGKTMCYPCAEENERKAFAEARIYGAYLSSDGKKIATWTGAVLASVVSYGASSLRYTPSGGRYRMEYVRAEAPDGSQWYGSKSDSMDAIVLHRLKNKR
jgi:hypothetical protein